MLKEWIIPKLSLLPGGSYLNNKYISALLIVVLSVISAFFLLWLFSKYLEKIAKKTQTELDDLIFDKTKKPLFCLIVVYGFKNAILYLGLKGWIIQFVNSLMAVVLIYILIGVSALIIEYWGKNFAKKTQSQIDDVLLPLFHKVVKAILGIILFLWILKIWQINITPYLAGAGIGGIILGFALQDSLKNIFGGVTLLLDKTFEIGDKIKLESGELGEVIDIGLRSTKIRTYDNELIYVPNGYLANSRVLNYTRPTVIVRVKVDFGVEYGSKVSEVKNIVLNAIKSMNGVLNEPAPAIQFLEMGDFALKFRACYWVPTWKTAFDKKLEGTEKIYDALNNAGIGIPFPTQSIYLKK